MPLLVLEETASCLGVHHWTIPMRDTERLLGVAAVSAAVRRHGKAVDWCSRSLWENETKRRAQGESIFASTERVPLAISSDVNKTIFPRPRHTSEAQTSRPRPRPETIQLYGNISSSSISSITHNLLICNIRSEALIHSILRPCWNATVITFYLTLHWFNWQH